VSTVPKPELHVTAGVLRDSLGRVLIAQRLPGTHLAGCWEFPGGKLRPGEEAYSALRRELREELGIEVIAARPFVRFSHEYPDRMVLLDVWWITEFSGEPSGMEGQPVRWESVERLMHMGLLAADRPIVDALLDGRLIP
jgi:8-oxo-dGTP diphosphatase